MGTVIIFAAPLIHIYFPRQNTAVAAYAQELDNVVKELEYRIKSTRSDYDNGRIGAEQYILAYDEFLLEKQSLRQENRKRLKAVEDSERIFGWKTTRLFLVGLGTRLPYLLFSLIISFLILGVNSKDSDLKKSFIFLQVACYTISFYSLVWVFWNAQDYPLELYRWAIIAICAISAIATTYFLMWYRSRIAKLRKALVYLWDVIVQKIWTNDVVRDYNQFGEKIVKPTIKGFHERTR